MRFSRFDLTVVVVAVALVALIMATAFLGIQEQGARLAFIRDGASGLPEVWLVEVTNPGGARQITETEYGVGDFDASPDGRYIAYTERDFESNISDIYLHDLVTGEDRQLTNCTTQDSDCTAPRFRSDGQYIAYERIDLNTGLGTGVGSSRIWIVDLTTNPGSTYPLFDEREILGYSPRWSADGSKLAFYDTPNNAILVMNFAESLDPGAEPDLSVISSQFGTVGSLSPDGTQMAYPEILLDGPQTRGYIQLADLEDGLSEVLTDPNELSDDQQMAWNPNGRYIAITRQYRDERATRGPQIYLVDTAEGNSISPLLVDEQYGHHAITWSLDGQILAMQRFRQLDDDGQVPNDSSIEVWTYDLDSRELTRISEDARNPVWLPPETR